MICLQPSPALPLHYPDRATIFPPKTTTFIWIAYNAGRYFEAEANWQEAHQTTLDTRDRQESALTLMGSAWLVSFNHGDFDMVKALAEEVPTLAVTLNSHEAKRRAYILFGFQITSRQQHCMAAKAAHRCGVTTP